MVLAKMALTSWFLLLKTTEIHAPYFLKIFRNLKMFYKAKEKVIHCLTIMLQLYLRVNMKQNMNEIRQTMYSLYRAKEIVYNNKKVYNNIMNSINL